MSEPKYPKGTFYVGREVYVMRPSFPKSHPVVEFMAKVEKVGRTYAYLNIGSIRFDLLSGITPAGPLSALPYLYKVYLSKEEYLAEQQP